MALVSSVATVIGIAIVLCDRLVPGRRRPRPPDDIDTLYDVLLIASVPIFVLVMSVAHLLACSPSAPSRATCSDGAPIHGNTRLEVVWVTIPLHHGHRARRLRLDRARRHRGQEARHAGRERDRPAVRLELRLPRRGQAQVEPARAAQGPPGRVPRSTPRTSSTTSGCPSSGSSPTPCPGITTKIRAHARPARQLRRGLRRAVRHRPLDDAPGRARGPSRATSTPGSTKQQQGARTAERPPPEATRPPPGKQLFTDTGCNACHTLADAGSTASDRPEPRRARRRRRQVRQAEGQTPEEYVKTVDRGPERLRRRRASTTGIMPDDYKDQLSPEEIDTLVKYLLERGRRGEAK